MFVKAPTIKYGFETEKELENKLKSTAKFIAEKLDLNLDIEDEVKDMNSLRYSDVKYVNYIFHKEKIKVKFRIQIPRYSDGMIQIKGVRRYVQKQLRDLLWVLPNDKYVKLLIGDFFIGLSYKGTFELNRITTPLVLLYYYFINEHYDEQKEDRLEHIFKTYPAFQSDYELAMNGKKSFFNKLTSIQAQGKVKKIITSLDLIYDIYPMLKEYFTDIPDILEKMVYLLPLRYPDDGLDLSYRRVRKELDIVFDAYIHVMIDRLTDVLFITNKKQQTFDLEPTKYLYDFILMEQFPAPLATVSDRYRVTILGSGGYNRDNVPIKVRNLHESHLWNLDPAVTPDRENAGIVLYLATNTELDQYGRFKNLIKDGYNLLNKMYDEGRNLLLSNEVQLSESNET